MKNGLSHVTTWLFDLDNTLYPAASDIFPQIHKRMSLFIMQRFGLSEAAAEKRREDYFHAYGTTMRGLMVEHKIDPDDFMDFVHDVGLDTLAPNPRLPAALERLKGRKIIFTNASRKHAVRLLNHLNIAHLFPDIFDIQDGGYVCKPYEETYRALLARYALKASECCMVDDMEVNLKAAAALGMRTLWLRHEADWLRHAPQAAGHYPHCHYTADDLIPFLETLNAEAA